MSFVRCVPPGSGEYSSVSFADNSRGRSERDERADSSQPMRRRARRVIEDSDEE